MKAQEDRIQFVDGFLDKYLPELLEDLENMKTEITHLTELVRNLIEIKEKTRLENLKWLSKKKQKNELPIPLMV